MVRGWRASGATSFPTSRRSTRRSRPGPGGSVSVVGGEDIVVTASSPNQEAALEFVRFTQSEQFQVEMAKTGQMTVVPAYAEQQNAIAPFYATSPSSSKTAKNRLTDHLGEQGRRHPQHRTHRCLQGRSIGAGCADRGRGADRRASRCKRTHDGLGPRAILPHSRAALPQGAPHGVEASASVASLADAGAVHRAGLLDFHCLHPIPDGAGRPDEPLRLEGRRRAPPAPSSASPTTTARCTTSTSGSAFPTAPSTCCSPCRRRSRSASG